MKFFRIAWILSALFLVSACDSPPVRNAPWVLRGTAMGTTWKIVISEYPYELVESEWRKRIEERLEDLESQMSHWREDSVLSKINNSRTVGSHEITMDMARVLGEAQRLSKLTTGAFDITAAPLIDAWGFGASGRAADLPTEDQIQSALERVGMSNFEVEARVNEAPQLRLIKLGTRLDLSALAKGYAIDSLAEMLDAAGVHNFLIEFGGELRGSGVNSEGTAWRVGLESPAAQATSTGRVRQVIELRDLAVATSGTYRNFVDGSAGGKRLAHIIDPRTGRPVEHGLVSVSVIDKSAMRADAWATALLVLGLRDGFRIAEERDVAATFVSENAGAEKSTEGFLRICE